ncbi:hypothetical protein [Nonomuraea sp. GTA35]|uniref:hypothetical protein n=1 Tax=Nonomuraea sp. GTA35 TaxID=1676746 RepID=UPI0035BF6695
MSDQKRALTAGVALLERAIDYALGSLRIVTPAALCRPTPCAAWNLHQLLHHLDDSLQALHEAAAGHIRTGPELVNPAPHARAAAPVPHVRAADPATRARAADPAVGARAVNAPPRDAPSGLAAGLLGPAGTPPACDPAGGPAAGCGTGAAAAGGPPSVPALWTRNPALVLRDSATEVLGRWIAATSADLVTIHDRHLTSPMVAAAGAIEITAHAWDVARACGEHHPIPPLLAEELLDLAHLFVTRADRPARFARPVTVPMSAPAQDHLLAHLGRHPTWPEHN